MASHHSTLTFPSVDLGTPGLPIGLIYLHAGPQKIYTVYIVTFHLSQLKNVLTSSNRTLLSYRDVNLLTGVEIKISELHIGHCWLKRNINSLICAF